jgi:hypothetical protein
MIGNRLVEGDGVFMITQYYRKLLLYKLENINFLIKISKI